MKKTMTAVAGAALLFAGCEGRKENCEVTYRFVRTETLDVASEKGIYMGALASWPCTMVRTSSDGQWFAAPVNGFDYEPGYEYVVEADKYRAVVPEGMCYDGPGDHYVLKRVISKVRRDTPGMAWFVPCYDSWPGIPGEWLDTEKNVLHVIRSQEELERYSAPAGEDKVDFDKYSVLLVSGAVNSGIAKIDRTLIYRGGGKYDYRIDILVNAACVLSPWQVAVLVPVTPEPGNVALTVGVR